MKPSSWGTLSMIEHVQTCCQDLPGPCLGRSPASGLQIHTARRGGKCLGIAFENPSPNHSCHINLQENFFELFVFSQAARTNRGSLVFCGKAPPTLGGQTLPDGGRLHNCDWRSFGQEWPSFQILVWIMTKGLPTWYTWKLNPPKKNT